MTEHLFHVESGDPSGPALLMGTSLGTTHHMWDELAAQLAGSHRIIQFDLRGHGRSAVPEGPYRVAELTADIIALADELGLAQFRYIGLSLGGHLGLDLAIRYPQRLSALVAACTSAWFGDPKPWLDRAARVRAEGMEWLVPVTEERWFTPEFAAAHPERVAPVLAMVAANHPEGYASCAEAIAGSDLRPGLAGIAVPTLVLAGGRDPVSPAPAMAAMADAIPAARLHVIDGVSHMAQTAAAEEFFASVDGFLAGVSD